MRRRAQARRGRLGERAESIPGVPQARLMVGLRVGHHTADAGHQRGQTGPARPGRQGIAGLPQPMQGVPQERPAVDPRVLQHHVNTAGQLTQVRDEGGALSRRTVRCHDGNAFLVLGRSPGRAMPGSYRPSGHPGPYGSYQRRIAARISTARPLVTLQPSWSIGPS